MHGRVDGGRFDLWNATWLPGKPVVFIPDKEQGPWAKYYKPVHMGTGSHVNATVLYRFRTDQNMLWSAFEANATIRGAEWVFVGDDDTMPFEHTIQRKVRGLDPSQPIVLGVAMARFRNGVAATPWQRPAQCTAKDACPADKQDRPGCCTCPVVRSGGGWAVSHDKGFARYRNPPTFFYGGTGILLSRGLLDAIPTAEWTECTNRLICGPSDYRLLTCIYNLLPSVCAIQVRFEFLPFSQHTGTTRV